MVIIMKEFNLEYELNEIGYPESIILKIAAFELKYDIDLNFSELTALLLELKPLVDYWNKVGTNLALKKDGKLDLEKYEIKMKTAALRHLGKKL